MFKSFFASFLSNTDRPRVLVALDSLLGTQVVAGRKSSLRCQVKSNPAPVEMHWLFNGQLLEQQMNIGTENENNY